MIGIGPEFLGYEEFKKGQYFCDKTYIDVGKQLYHAMGYKSNGIWNGYGLLDPGFKKAYREASENGVTGNLTGDGFQMGGVVIVDNKGKILFDYEQKYYGDDPKVEEILKVIEEHYADAKNK